MPWMALAVRGGDRVRRAGLLGIALAVAGVLVAGCSGGPADPGVAGVSSATASPSQSATVSGEAEALQYAACMRSHGVPDFPDPNKNGGFSGTSTVNPSSPTFQNAQSTCMQLSGLGGPGSSS
jgi:hypothetical protein